MKAKINTYLSTKNIKRRRRTDEIMIVAAIIGIAGTILVFNSYASRKIETQNPGSYSFVKLISQSGSKYSNIAKVKAVNGEDVYYMNKSSSISTPFTLPANKICVYGWNRVGGNIEVGFSNIPNKLILNQNNMSTDYPLSNSSSRALKCYETSSFGNTKGNLILNSNGEVWLDKVVTE